MKRESDYIIQGGIEGKKRLDVIGEILNEKSEELIELDENISDFNFLDLGCGGGNLSLMIAKKIGHRGKVTAIDFDSEIIKLAQEDAFEQRITNISFEVLDAYNINYSNHFDIAYSRFLLSHLKEPMQVITNMTNSLKSGGKIIIEDIDFSGHFCYPECKDFDLYLHYFTTAAKNNKQNPNIGLSLFQLLKQANIDNVKFDLIQPLYNIGKGKWMAYFTMDKIKETVIRQGLATEAEVSNVLDNLEKFTNDENSIISLPRIFRVWGYKT